MTVKEIIDDVRRAISDTAEPYTVSPETMLQLAVEAQHDITANSTEAAIASDGTLLTVTAPVTLGSTLSVGNEWRPAMFHYICSRAFILKGFDKENITRSKTHRDLYDKELR